MGVVFGRETLKSQITSSLGKPIAVRESLIRSEERPLLDGRVVPHAIHIYGGAMGDNGNVGNLVLTLINAETDSATEPDCTVQFLRLDGVSIARADHLQFPRLN